MKGEPVHGEHNGGVVRMARKLQGSANRIEGGMVDDFGNLDIGQTLGHRHLHAMNTARWTYQKETINWTYPFAVQKRKTIGNLGGPLPNQLQTILY